MYKLSTRQRTLAGVLEFSGCGVHNGAPASLTISPAPPNSGLQVARLLPSGTQVGPVPLHFSRLSKTTLCTTLDLGRGIRLSTLEHVVSALAGLGVDNALIAVSGGAECPILDGSAWPIVDAIVDMGLSIQAPARHCVTVQRAITIRHADSYAVFEPYKGRLLDVEIDYDNAAVGHQHFTLEWSPRRYAEDVAAARTFGFAQDERALRQAGYALGTCYDSVIRVGARAVLNEGGLRYPDEFVRHKLLDAVGDLAFAGLPIFGKFRSYKGGHALHALALSALFANEANYAIVQVEDLPWALKALDDLPQPAVAWAGRRAAS